MEAQAVQKFVRMSPRKVRLVADSLKDLKPSEAVERLYYVRKRAAKPLRKTIRSAIANAVVKGASEEELEFKELMVSEGPKSMKRGRAGSRGMVMPIIKRMSHIKVVVTDGKGVKNES